MRCLPNVWHDRRAEATEALRAFPQDAIHVREVQVHLVPRTAREASHAEQSAEQTIANGAFALGMATGVAFVVAAIMLAKLLGI